MAPSFTKDAVCGQGFVADRLISIKYMQIAAFFFFFIYMYVSANQIFFLFILFILLLLKRKINTNEYLHILT